MGNDKKRKFLFVSPDGDAGDLAWQLKKEGSEVKYYIKSSSDKDVFDGFVDKTEDWESQINWADVIVFDYTGFGEIADKLRKEGKLVIGGSAYTDKLEEDREFGQNELKGVGINVLSYHNFTSFDDAIEFVKEHPDRYVIKPSGKAEGEKQLTFTGMEEDGNDIIQILQIYKRSWAKKIKMFQIQKFASGVEVAVGAFFNGKDFMFPINVNFEHKKLFPGEIGPSTGELGESMYWSQTNKIFKETLGKMKEKLASSRYTGYIDINCIVNYRDIYPLEFTSRFGYPTISIQMEGITSRWTDFLYAIASGQDFDLKTKKGFQVGVVIAVPPFPFTDHDSFKKYSEDATVIFKKNDFDGIHIADVKLVEGDWVLAGRSGYCLVVTGSGTTMEEARKNTYNRVKNIIIPNMFYRTDIGLRWQEDSDRLFTWGYLL